jgi:polysaccharide transporter, PST family
MKRRIIFNQLALLIQYAANSLIPLILMPQIIREIGLESFGRLSVILSISVFGAIFVNYCFLLSAVPRIVQTESRHERGIVVSRILCARCFLFILVSAVFLLGVLIALFLGYNLNQADIIMLFSLPLATAFNMSWYLQAEERFGYIAGSALIAVALALYIGLIEIEKNENAKIILAAVAMSMAPLITGLFTFIIGAAHLKQNSTPVKWLSPFSDLQSGWPLFGGIFVSGLYGSSGTLIVGSIAGPYQAGLYAAVERFANAASNACLLLHSAAYPKLSIEYQRNRKRYFHLLAFVFAGYYLSVSFIFTIAIIFWPQMVEYFMGTMNKANADAFLAGLFWVSSMVFGVTYAGYMTVSGKSDRIFKLTIQLLLITLLIGLPGVWIFGAIGWIVAILLSQLFVAAVAKLEWGRDYKSDI